MRLHFLLLEKTIKRCLIASSQCCKKGRVRSLSSLVLCFAILFLWTSIFPLSIKAETKSVSRTYAPPVELVPTLPESFGQVIYRVNAKSSKQLYIIGISHRGPFLGGDASTTLQTQSELYRIGEWLKRNKNLELLLPEGFFNCKVKVPAKHLAINVDDLSDESHLSVDDNTLKKKLSDHTCFVNAEMLLMKNLHMQAGQVEDRGLYDEVYSRLLRLGTIGKDSKKFLRASSDLRRLQKMRTAFILQKAPEVIDARFDLGDIHKRQALLTIGLNHLHEIIRYINKNEINIDPSFDGQDSYESRLNLIKEGFGITIIIPQVLASDRTVLEMTGLDRIHMASLQATDSP